MVRNSNSERWGFSGQMNYLQSADSVALCRAFSFVYNLGLRVNKYQVSQYLQILMPCLLRFWEATS
jgi:hypothetical protein